MLDAVRDLVGEMVLLVESELLGELELEALSESEGEEEDEYELLGESEPELEPEEDSESATDSIWDLVALEECI